MDIRQLFQTSDLARIDEYIATGQEENLFLDFKTIKKADLSERDDRKTFAKALSGFANSSGGLIVWGVDARKNSEGIDCAKEKKEIVGLRMFISKLNEFTGSFVTPVVDGVEHKLISSGNDAGFAVTLVPASDSCPHMAKAGEDRYYKRSGDSFYKMEHFDLEDMFGRRARPKLVIKRKNFHPTHDGRWCINFDVVNEGRGTAKLIYIEIPQQDGVTPEQGIRDWRWLGSTSNASDGSAKSVFDLVSTSVIHPGMAQHFASLYLKSPNFTPGESVRLLCTLYCEGCLPVQTVVEGTLPPLPNSRRD